MSPSWRQRKVKMAQVLPKRNTLQLAYLVLCVAPALCILGCLGTSADEQAASAPKLPKEPDALQTRLDDVLTYTLRDRVLNVDDHAAWQILHGALAYQRDFEVQHDGTSSSAVDYVMAGGEMKGWICEPGKLIDADKDRRGLIAVMQPGSKQGQGHHDQWLAILAQCGFEETAEIVYGGRTYTVRDYVEQVKWDAPRNLESEFSWTLIGLTAYESTDAKWTASDGQEWSIERLLQAEVDFQLGEGACGGTHRLIGITMCLQKHLAAGGTLEGVWLDADRTIRLAVDTARMHQNPDGTFSTNYVIMPGSSPDLAQNLGSTGHVLEFLSLALSENQLNDDWVERAVVAMCDIFDKTREVPLECGALYHAAHGLVLYRERRFGATTYTGS